MEGATILRRPRLMARLAWLWCAIMSVVLFWQKATYWGLYAFAAELQFDAFGTYRPALTYLSLLAILWAPLLLLPLSRWRESRLKQASLSPDVRMSLTIGATSRWVRTLFGAAIAVAVAALAIALSTMWLPSASGAVSQIAVSDEAAPPPLGPVLLSGRLLPNKAAVLNEDFFFLRRSSRFAPMVAEGSDQTVLHYFVELPVDAPIVLNDAKGERKGILRRGGLPGELVSLYRYTGFRIDPSYHVLFSSAEAMRRAELTEALELLILAAFLGLIGAIFAFRGRRLSKVALASAAQLESD